MMSSATEYLRQKIGDHLTGQTAYTMPSTVYLALFSTATAADGTGTELSGSGYARIAIAWDATTAAGLVDNTSLIQSANATADWATATHAAIYDAATGGNMLLQGALPSSQTVLNGNRFLIDPGDLALTIA